MRSTCVQLTLLKILSCSNPIVPLWQILDRPCFKQARFYSWFHSWTGDKQDLSLISDTRIAGSILHYCSFETNLHYCSFETMSTKPRLACLLMATAWPLRLGRSLLLLWPSDHCLHCHQSLWFSCYKEGCLQHIVSIDFPPIYIWGFLQHNIVGFLFQTSLKIRTLMCKEIRNKDVQGKSGHWCVRKIRI